MNAAAALLSLQCLLFSTVVLTREPSTVWNCQDFSGIHILREIIFESLEGIKLSFLPIKGSEFWYFAKCMSKSAKILKYLTSEPFNV